MADNVTTEVRRVCLKFLDGVLATIDTLGNGVYVLDDECLVSLNIRMAEPLNIEENGVDFGPRFFYPRYTLEEARQQTAAYLADLYPDPSDYPEWAECRPYGPQNPQPLYNNPHPLHNRMSDAEARLSWCADVIGGCSLNESRNQGIWGGSY